MDNNLDNNQGGRRPDKGDPRRDLDPNRNKKNHQSILAFLPLDRWCTLQSAESDKLCGKA